MAQDTQKQETQAQKISDVIKRLEQIKKKQGDLEIFVDYDGEWQWFNSKEFVLMQDQNGVNVIVIE